jgi:Ni/Co efflux regulator RcnB
MEHIMKVNQTISLALALTLATSGIAFAQGHGNRDGDGRGEREAQGQRGDARWQREHRDERRGDNGLHKGWYKDERGAGADQRWHRGDRLPMEYRHRNYVVDDWRGHHLSAPPRGYYWVQNGNDYLLVAITTGVIAQLLLGNR